MAHDSHKALSSVKGKERRPHHSMERVWLHCKNTWTGYVVATTLGNCNLPRSHSWYIGQSQYSNLGLPHCKACAFKPRQYPAKEILKPKALGLGPRIQHIMTTLPNKHVQKREAKMLRCPETMSYDLTSGRGYLA